MNTPTVTTMQHVSFADAMTAAKASAEAYKSQAGRMVQSFALAFFAGVYGEPQRSRDEVEKDIRDQLKLVEGFEQSTVYRYVAISKALCSRIITEHQFGGTTLDILKAKKPEGALNALSRETDRMCGGDTSLTRLCAYLNVYQTRPKQQGGGTGPGAPAPAVVATNAKPKAIAARIAKEPTILNEVAPEALTTAMAAPAMESHRVKFVVAAIKAVTDIGQLGEIQRELNAHLAALAKAQKAAPVAAKVKPKGRGKAKGEAEITTAEDAPPLAAVNA